MGIVAHKNLGTGGGQQGIDGRIQITVGSVFEPHRHGKRTGPLAVILGFGGPGADAGPGNQPGQTLGSRLAQDLGPHGYAHLVEVHQYFAGFAHPLIDVETFFIDMGIGDQALETHIGSRFFEIDPHDQFDGGLDLFLQSGQPLPVFDGLTVADDGTRAGDHHQPAVPAAEDVLDFPAALHHRAGSGFRHGEFFPELVRSNDRGTFNYI
jgi:hypothetical protein